MTAEESIEQLSKQLKDAVEARNLAYLQGLKKAMRARREEVDRIVDYIEMAIFGEDHQETVDALIGLASKVLRV